jgi:hypothetical protein
MMSGVARVDIDVADEGFKDRDIGVVFRPYFISNPDLVFKVKEKIAFMP